MSNMTAMEPTDVGCMQPLAPPKLPYFSGDPADGPAEDFEAEVGRVLAAYPMSDEMAAYFVYSHLTGAARTEVKLHSWEETNSTAKVTSILVRVFGDKRRLSTLMTAFFSRRQQPGEDILDYSHAVSSLEVAIRRKDRNALNSTVVRDKFIDGLVHPTLRKELRHFTGRRPHSTFLEARAEARQLERELEEEALYQQQRDCHHHVKHETKELKNELTVLKEKFRILADTLESLENSQLGTVEQSQGKRKRRRRRSKKKAHSQVSTDTRSMTGRDSNHSGCPEQASRVNAIPHTSQPCNEDDEPCYSGWVLLPSPPGTSHSLPRKGSRGFAQRSPASAEARHVMRSPRQHEVDRRWAHVSHLLRIDTGNATQIKHPNHSHRGREIKWA